ncbi:hypothetical protein Q0Z83_040380 [Actinoplanes sichuanensis]|uniref:Uncharacterized protein n=1 Tax=Actinoplanes sichuanensis TaxID=512349 RepID=A0ABW4A3Y6_9ACTN|nr:hypothetical protein [Actinoplanes sichuanensis]BEL05847.1 hypothetical protein Q0Z83_040380 [Actinoplanes sichuanensis]
MDRTRRTADTGAALGLEHDIVTVERLGPVADDLYPRYVDLYEAAAW